MKTLVLLDTETTGLDPKTEHCIEVAVALYDVPAASLVTAFSSLLWHESNAAESINRIPVDLIKRGPDRQDAWRIVVQLAGDLGGQAAFVAHRAEFDRGFVPTYVRDLLPWVCSKFDIEWPLSKPGASLVEVALAHGVPVHDNHRALTDVMLLVRTFQRVAELGHDVPAMLARAMRPKSRFVSLAPFEQKDVVKSHGFAWDPAAREWSRRMAREDVAALPFRVREGA